MLEGMYRDIATTVAEKCVNPETKRPYTVTMIEKAMADLHLSVNPSRSAKSQALDVIKQLLEKKTIPIARAQMRIRIVVPSKDGKRIKDKLMTMIASKEDEDLDENYEWVRATLAAVSVILRMNFSKWALILTRSNKRC